MGIDKEIEKRVISGREAIKTAEIEHPLPRTVCRDVGSYAEEKLRCIRGYLYVYSKIVSKNFPTSDFYYVETHSGPGVCNVRGSGRKILGSPLLALTNEPFFKKFRFVELDNNCVRSLRMRISKYCPLPIKRTTKIFCGDCNQVINKVLNEFEDNIPCLIIIDPENASQLKWTTLEACSKKNSELYINFTYDMDMKRRLLEKDLSTTDEDIESITEFYGCKDWMQIRKDYLSGKISPSTAREKFLGLYMKRIHSLLNYASVVPSKIIRGEKNQPLYYLIHACRKEVARRTMRQIMRVDYKQTKLD